MRLLNVHTLELEEFTDEDLPPYAITSHRWGKTSHETTYDDVAHARQQQKPGYQKVLSFCKFVRECQLDLDWIWIDTCCIDKRNLVELSEAINSMYRWYAESAICIALLHDVYQEVYVGPEPLQLSNSEWFKRGWTLQELLAPTTVVFADSAWRYIGAKITTGTPLWLRLVHSSSIMQGYVFELSKASGIPHEILAGDLKLSSVDVETKMSWMRDRNTTRAEDRAYCLLGIFNVYLPPIYGERENAMMRLKREIAAASGSGDFAQLREPRVPVSWATKYEKQIGTRSAAGRAVQPPNDIATGVPRFRIENERPPDPKELSEALRKHQDAGKQPRRTSDEAVAEKPKADPMSTSGMTAEELLQYNAIMKLVPNRHAQAREKRDGQTKTAAKPRQQGAATSPESNHKYSKSQDNRFSAESKAQPLRREEPKATGSPPHEDFPPLFDGDHQLYVAQEARVRNRSGVAVGKVVLTTSNSRNLLGQEVASNGLIWVGEILVGFASPYVPGVDGEATHEIAASTKKFLASHGVEMRTEDEQRPTPSRKSATPRPIGLHNCYVVHEGRVRDERGHAVGKVVLTNSNVESLVGRGVDRDGGIRTDDGRLVAIAAPFLPGATKGTYTEITQGIPLALRAELRENGPALSPSVATVTIEGAEKTIAVPLALSSKQTGYSFSSLSGLRVVDEGRVRDSDGIAVGRIVTTAGESRDDLVGCKVDARGRVLRDGGLVALAATYISADSERTGGVDEDLQLELSRVRAQRLTENAALRTQRALAAETSEVPKKSWKKAGLNVLRDALQSQ
ncbi:Vegetative incompatibility protein HET-E-1 [Cercospora beticola]|uniref:Vegetative incompatibility protein HET-E-1 n=1 Tax=Cercospora beticola TaxID=122368 RepID=A0A2G5GJ43_CERBT|nr:Vegetative incompatibility protein HET-E-1 [Cercospora beticola]PIA80013.1 Vegetative incompatibility protein HET-E-1 [Cercospora beticola]WPB07619.1 hypothetical protein RHO25_012280 [Cercospora beticola]CAK1356581.1 unnamed protein product [Cercospora beticola]